MDIGQGIIWLAVICVIILCIAGWQKKKVIITNFIIRLGMGIVMIMTTNFFLAQARIDVAVGLNPFSLMAAGILGVPGIAMLYGIAGCKFI